MAEAGTYKRSLGLFELVSLGVGGTIGSGIFVVPGVAAKLSGPWSLLAWLIVALSASCVLLSLAYVSFRFTSSNSFYSLFSLVFGQKIAVPLIGTVPHFFCIWHRNYCCRNRSVPGLLWHFKRAHHRDCDHWLHSAGLISVESLCQG